MSKWYKGIFRRSLTDMHIPDFDDAFLSKFNAEEYYRNLVTAKVQSPMIYLQSHTGLCNYPTATGKTHNAFTKGENQLKKLIALCKDGGMKVVGYYSLVFNNWATDTHPDWEMVNADGTTWRDHGQRYGLCCPNNEDYRAWTTKQIDELAKEFPTLDGLFYDMPYWEVACHCPSCQEKYRAKYGVSLPTVCDFKDQEWLRYLRARQDWMVEFVQFVKAYTSKVMPWVTVEFNYAAAVGCDWMAGSTEGINAESEFTGGDLYGDLYCHSFAAKYYYGVTPNQPFEYMTCRCDKTLREHTVTKTQKALEREVLLTAAHHGASLIIDAVDPVGTLDQRVYQRIGKVFERQLPYEKYMDKGSLYADVAVYFDTRTVYRADEDVTDNKTCAIGAMRILAENHIPQTIVSNANLHDLSKYQMVVAPSMQDFDNDAPLQFIDYVKGGGTLYLSGGSDSRLIKEFFGGKVTGKTYDGLIKPHVQMGARAYLSPVYGEKAFGEFNRKYPMPVTYHLPILEGAKGKVRATITTAYAAPDDNYRFASIHSCPPWTETNHPALLETTYGKGKVIWIAATPESDQRYAFQDLFIQLVRENVTPKYQILAGRNIEAVVFEDKDLVLLSLCDLTYDDGKINKPATFSFACPRAPKCVVDAADEQELPFAYENGALQMQISFDDFAMIAVKF